MIQRYNQFIKENTLIKPENFGIINDYKWNGDLLDVYGNVVIKPNLGITELPFRFGKVYKSFSCTSNSLTTLKNSPVYVGGNFNCKFNNITSLEGCPQIVEGSFFSTSNKLKSSIEDYPISVIYGNLFYDDFLEDPIMLCLDHNLVHYICDLIKKNDELFFPLLDNKIKFHQMIMRLDSNLIRYYNYIDPPSKKATLLI